MSEKPNSLFELMGNKEASQEEIKACQDLAAELRKVAPKDVVVGNLIKSLEMAYRNAAIGYFQTQLDKFRSAPKEAIILIYEKLLSSPVPETWRKQWEVSKPQTVVSKKKQGR